MKSLKTIQVLAKIGKILSLIVFICCLVGVGGSIIGIITLAAIPKGIMIGKETFIQFLERTSRTSIGTCYALMATSIILCAGEAVLAKFAHVYFKREIAAGTPFTFAGAKELKRLGILTIAIPIGTAAVAAIVYSAFKLVHPEIPKFNYSNGASICLGIMFIIMSLFCKYGAEREVPVIELREDRPEGQ